MGKLIEIIRNNLKKTLIVTAGSVLVAVGIYFFIMDHNIPIGGLSGFAIGVQNLYPEIQVGYLMTIINIVLFIISYIFLGKEYVGFTLYSSLLVSNVITILENLVPIKNHLTENILLSMIIGVLLSGLGVAIVITQNATTGGTEIIASIINKYTNIEIGKSILISDLAVVLFGMYAIGVEAAMYGVIGLGLTTVVIDWYISGLNTKINMVIITKEYGMINEFITSHMDRGSTIYYAKGGFSKDEKQVIHTVVSRKEYFAIKDYIIEIDPLAFVTMNYVNEVVGEGFTRD